MDFEDLLLLTYRLLSERTKIADFYRRLYRYICIDEAQDLNEAQYAVIKALCGSTHQNVMMVGDPKQSVYGFNTSDPKYMLTFASEFGARTIELTDNFRSSRAVVNAAQLLEPTYDVGGRLPLAGALKLLIGNDEKEEARTVAEALQELFNAGHPDIEGPISYERCAILGRTRYSLLAIEEELKKREWPYHKQLSANYESSSDLIRDFDLALHVLVNPLDALHSTLLAKRWDSDLTSIPAPQSAGIALLEQMAKNSKVWRAAAVVHAARALAPDGRRLRMMEALSSLCEECSSPTSAIEAEERRAIWEDVRVWQGEWDRYVRSVSGSQHNLAGFLSCVALGTTQQPRQEGIGLITVHSAKGLEFDVVCIVGMADGTFPDYRARGSRVALAEEKRVVFVALTRSRRLLFLSFPKTKQMPWGEIWQLRPSPYLQTLGLL